MPHHEYPDEVEDPVVTIAMMRRTIRHQRVVLFIYFLLLALVLFARRG